MLEIKIKGVNHTQVITFKDKRIVISVRFYPVARCWAMDVVENGVIRCQNMPLSVGVPILKRSATAYFFYVYDTSGERADPVHEHSFLERYQLYLIERGQAR